MEGDIVVHVRPADGPGLQRHLEHPHVRILHDIHKVHTRVGIACLSNLLPAAGRRRGCRRGCWWCLSLSECRRDGEPADDNCQTDCLLEHACTYIPYQHRVKRGIVKGWTSQIEWRW